MEPVNSDSEMNGEQCLGTTVTSPPQTANTPTRTQRTRRNQRSGAVTSRPSGGSAYRYVPGVYRNTYSTRNDITIGPWMWVKMVIAFSVSAFIGLLFVLCGSVILGTYHDQSDVTYAFCVIGIVCGVLMFFGSLVIGKMMISKKWMKVSREPSQQRDSSGTQSQTQDPDLPPAYDQVVTAVDRMNYQPPEVQPMQAFVLPKYTDVAMELPSYGDIELEKNDKETEKNEYEETKL